MTILKKPFRPACNREGLSNLTFKNTEPILGKNGKPYLRLRFNCMGMDRSINQLMSIVISPQIDNPYSVKVLQKMGMENPNEDELKEFLYSCQRHEFLACVSKGDSGYWIIDVETLKPYK